MMVRPGAPARLCAILTQGHDHVAAEGARLLLRLWLPACARTGQPPWQLPAAPSGGFQIAAGDSPRPVTSVQDEAASSTAKSVILSQAGRSVSSAFL